MPAASTTGSASESPEAPRDSESDALALRPFDPAVTDPAEVKKRVEQALAICDGPEPTPSWSGGGSTPHSKRDRTLCSTGTLSKLLLLQGLGNADADQEAAKKSFYLALAFDPAIVLPARSGPKARSAYGAAKKLPVPRIRFGAVKSKDDSLNKAIGTALGELMPHVRCCYAAGLLDNPNLTGDAELRMVLDVDGRLTDPSVSVSGPLPHGGVLSCVKRHAGRTTFARPSKAPFYVGGVPMTFTPH